MRKRQSEPTDRGLARGAVYSAWRKVNVMAPFYEAFAKRDYSFDIAAKEHDEKWESYLETQLQRHKEGKETDFDVTLFFDWDEYLDDQIKKYGNGEETDFDVTPYLLPDDPRPK